MIFCYDEGAGVMPIIEFSNQDYKISYTQLPNWIVTEVVELCQDFGFIEGRIIKFDNNIALEEIKNMEEILEQIRPKNTKTIAEAQTTLNIFFHELEKKFSGHKIPEKSPIFGLFRMSSPYDIDVVGMRWELSNFLDFLLINTQEMINFYGADFFPEIEKNSGLLLEYSSEKKIFFFSKSSSIELEKMIFFKGEKYPLILRMIPGFASPGFYFLLSIDTGKSSENICMQIGVRFERINNLVIPVIHNIQTPLYHLAIDHDEGIVTTPYLTDNMKKAKELMSQKSLYDFVGAIVSLFFSWGYTNIQIIDGHESLWLKYHNSQRTSESLENSARMYMEAGKHITGIDYVSGRISPTLKEILYHEIARLQKLGFEEDCLRGLFKIFQRFMLDFSREIKMEKINKAEKELFFSYIGTMREELLNEKINPRLHS